MAVRDVSGLGTATAHSDDIGQVLQRSQQMRLDAFTLADVDSLRAQTLRQSFARLVQLLDLHQAVELRVVRGEVIGETLQGKVVVVNESLAALPEGERLFVLAHEIGHVALDHWVEMGALYRKWVPGEVVQAQTDAVAGSLGREASMLAHQQEYQADAFALRTMRALGRSDDEVLTTFVHLGLRNDTATHPGTRKRINALRAAMQAETRVAETRPASSTGTR